MLYVLHFTLNFDLTWGSLQSQEVRNPMTDATRSLKQPHKRGHIEQIFVGTSAAHKAQEPWFFILQKF